jgi:hypothetical protein
MGLLQKDEASLISWCLYERFSHIKGDLSRRLYHVPSIANVAYDIVAELKKQRDIVLDEMISTFQNWGLELLDALDDPEQFEEVVNLWFVELELDLRDFAIKAIRKVYRYGLVSPI